MDKLNFENIDNLIYLSITLIILLLMIIALRDSEKRLKNLADKKILNLIFNSKSSTKKIIFRRYLFISISSIFLVIALIRPQYGFKEIESKVKGLDIAIAIDVSSSMLAKDIYPNRLERARREVLDLLDNLKGDRVSLIAFAGIAFIEAPLTIDYSTISLFLNNLGPQLVPIKGTNVVAALEKSLESLNDSKTDNSIIILITDGEDFEGNFSNIEEKLKEKGISIYVVGIGTSEGAPIPENNGFKKDKRGSLIITKLNEEALKKLAQNTGGSFVKTISNNSDIINLYEISIKKKHFEEEKKGFKRKVWNEYYQYFLAMGIFFLYFAWKSKTHNKILLIIFFLLTTNLLASKNIASAEENLDLNIARKEFENSNYKSSLEQYEKLLNENKNSKDLNLIYQGIGLNQYRLNQFQEAEKSFSQAIKIEPSAENLYNLANSLAQQEKYEQALEIYTKALELKQNDSDIQSNLDYVKKKIKEQEKKKEKDNKQEKNKEDKEQNKNKKEEQEKNSKDNKDQNKDKKDDSEQKKDDKQNSSKPENEKEKKNSEENENKNKRDNSKEENKEQENKEQENKDKKTKDQQENKNHEKEQSQQGQAQENQENEPKSSNSDINNLEQEKGNLEQKDLEKLEKKELSLQSQTILESIEENKEQLQKFRLRQAWKELQKKKVNPPKQDW